VIYYGYVESRRQRDTGRNRDTYVYGSLSQSEQDAVETADDTRLGEKGGRESLTKWGEISLIGMAVVLVIEAVLVATGKQEWLDLVYCMSYIKLYIR